MYDPTLDSLDAQLRIARAIWRRQRMDGASRDSKRRQLTYIDGLLDKRNAITKVRAVPPVAAVTA